MVLEVLLPGGFTMVLEWLAKGELREQMRALETAAGRQVAPEEPRAATSEEPDIEGAATTTPSPAEPADTSAFSEDLIRWAKLTPSLSDDDLTPYLYLAASFSGTPLLDAGLPVRLRDIAAKLLSSVRAQQKAVTTDDLVGLTAPDGEQLVQHLARAARDRPTEQQAAMLGIIRIVKQHPPLAEIAASALRGIPTADLQPGAILLFQPVDLAIFGDVLHHWLNLAQPGPLKAALTSVLAAQA